MKKLLLTFAFCLTAGVLCAQSAARQFVWEQANLQMARAQKPEDFRAAAQTYLRLVNEEGVCDVPLFLNLGSALVLAGDARHAERIFLRAERYAGTTPEVSTGLAAVRTLRNQPMSAMDWRRALFFWHFHWGAPIRTQVALAAWVVFWVVLAAGRFFNAAWYRKPMQGIAILAAVCCFAVTVSVGVTCLQEFNEQPMVLAEDTP